jgi:hypothetical protein
MRMGAEWCGMRRSDSTLPDSLASNPTIRQRLTTEQLRCLRRCARGISLRFEPVEIVRALVAGGYAKQGPAGVVSVTAKGLEYLRLRPHRDESDS